jgi:putative protease
MSESACLKRLERVKGSRLGCDLVVEMNGATMEVTATVAGCGLTMGFHLGSLESARTADMEGVLAAQFGRSGDTPFALSSFSAPCFPALAIPPARLKEIRREFYQALEEKVLPEIRKQRAAAKKRALASLGLQGRNAGSRRGELVVRLESVRDYTLLHEAGVDAVSFPVSKANMHQLPLFTRKLKGRETQVLWRLPFIIFESDIPFYREAVESIARFGFRRFEAANLSHFPLLKELQEYLAKPISRGCQGGEGGFAGDFHRLPALLP